MTGLPQDPAPLAQVGRAGATWLRRLTAGRRCGSRTCEAWISSTRPIGGCGACRSSHLPRAAAAGSAPQGSSAPRPWPRRPADRRAYLRRGAAKVRLEASGLLPMLELGQRLRAPRSARPPLGAARADRAAAPRAVGAQSPPRSRASAPNVRRPRTTTATASRAFCGEWQWAASSTLASARKLDPTSELPNGGSGRAAEQRRARDDRGASSAVLGSASAGVCGSSQALTDRQPKRPRRRKGGAALAVAVDGTAWDSAADFLNDPGAMEADLAMGWETRATGGAACGAREDWARAAEWRF